MLIKLYRLTFIYWFVFIFSFLSHVFLFSDEISMSMGFANFGKKSRDFDVEQLVEETRKTALERNKINIGMLGIAVSFAVILYF